MNGEIYYFATHRNAEMRLMAKQLKPKAYSSYINLAAKFLQQNGKANIDENNWWEYVQKHEQIANKTHTSNKRKRRINTEKNEE